jgi:hypothetical protein
MQHLTFALQSLAQLRLTWVALVGGAFLGFYRQVLLTMLLAVVLGVLATWADIKLLPHDGEALFAVWLGLIVNGLLCGIGCVVGRAASFAWSRTR